MWMELFVGILLAIVLVTILHLSLGKGFVSMYGGVSKPNVFVVALKYPIIENDKNIKTEAEKIIQAIKDREGINCQLASDIETVKSEITSFRHPYGVIGSSDQRSKDRKSGDLFKFKEILNFSDDHSHDNLRNTVSYVMIAPNTPVSVYDNFVIDSKTAIVPRIPTWKSPTEIFKHKFITYVYSGGLRNLMYVYAGDTPHFIDPETFLPSKLNIAVGIIAIDGTKAVIYDRKKLIFMSNGKVIKEVIPEAIVNEIKFATTGKETSVYVGTVDGLEIFSTTHRKILRGVNIISFAFEYEEITMKLLKTPKIKTVVCLTPDGIVEAVPDDILIKSTGDSIKAVDTMINRLGGDSKTSAIINFDNVVHINSTTSITDTYSAPDILKLLEKNHALMKNGDITHLPTGKKILTDIKLASIGFDGYGIAVNNSDGIVLFKC